MELREIDIWKIEAQEKARKRREKWAQSLLGRRARRMQNANQVQPTAEAEDVPVGSPDGDATGY